MKLKFISRPVIDPSKRPRTVNPIKSLQSHYPYKKWKRKLKMPIHETVDLTRLFL